MKATRPGDALALYQAGDAEGAATLARRVLALDPGDAEAHLCLALVALRGGEGKAAIENLRGCLRTRPADWLFTCLREDYATRGRFALSPADATAIGGLLRQAVPLLGPALAPAQRRADHPFVNVVGTSYVRSFGATTALFPLFIGMGPTTLLLTEEAAAATRHKFQANLARMDSTRDTLLVIGGDPYYHLDNRLGTRTEPEADQPVQADFDLMTLVAERHAPILADARRQLQGRVFLLGCTPTFSDPVNRLSRDLNRQLQPVCQAHGVELLDCWGELADPGSDRLRHDYSANAYPGDIHYTLSAVPIFIDALKARGALPADVASAADFEWSSMFDCEVVPGERTRLWSEPSVSPNNAFTSHKIAATHLATATANLLGLYLGTAADPTVAIINARDGLLPTLLPAGLNGGCLAITDSEQNRRAGQMALDFFGRPDVTLLAFGDLALAAVEERVFSDLVLLLHPGSEAEDEARCNAVLSRVRARRILVATPDPARIANLQLPGAQMQGPISISNRHIPETWRNYSLFVSG